MAYDPFLPFPSKNGGSGTRLPKLVSANPEIKILSRMKVECFICSETSQMGGAKLYGWLICNRTRRQSYISGCSSYSNKRPAGYRLQHSLTKSSHINLSSPATSKKSSVNPAPPDSPGNPSWPSSVAPS